MVVIALGTLNVGLVIGIDPVEDGIDDGGGITRGNAHQREGLRQDLLQICSGALILNLLSRSVIFQLTVPCPRVKGFCTSAMGALVGPRKPEPVAQGWSRES